MRMRAKFLVVFGVALIQLVASSSPSYAVGGALDTSFDGDGKVLTDFFGSFDASLEVASAPDGRTVVAGVAHRLSGGAEFAVARYNVDGSLDPTFDGDGKATAAFGTCDAWAFGLAVLPGGKIVLGGASYGRLAGDECGTEIDFALARFNRDGSLDPSFGDDGKVTTDFGASGDGSTEEMLGLAVGPQGTITAIGGVPAGFGLARYKPDGTLDNSFDEDGRVVTDFGGGGQPQSVAIAPNGQIVAVGAVFVPATSSNDFGIVRYNSDGSLDGRFGVGGKVTTDFGTEGDGSHEGAQDVAIDANGRIVAVGGIFSPFQRDFAVARYDTDGSLDASFDGDGKVTTDFGGSDSAEAVSIYPNGTIVATGGTRVGGTGDFAISRYRSDGGLDLSFDGDGTVVTDFGGEESAFAVAIQSDGRIVAAGPGPQDFAVARYLGR